ncbi:MAG: peptidylprolyl isomerase [Bacteroidetes bacterium]|nr:peptidylprolyl isomerase [Bacteroidota bacterium]
MRTLPLLLFLCLCSSVNAQDEVEAARKYREKVEAILRIQDRRTTHDGKLVSLLSDSDPLIRERAVRAFASIQDTQAIPLLTGRLADPDWRVQEAAAFAIGQTAIALSQEARMRLENDLIWKRLPDSRVPERLLEEIGKFGTEEGLNDIMIRSGNIYPDRHPEGTTLCIARYAIRGIVNADAIRYLLRRTRQVESTPWQVVYALQRIGDDPEIVNDIEFLVLLRQHTDPLVRMNLAALLGKAKNDRVAVEPLRRMAEFDADWRVRVNALKSLALYPLRKEPGSLLIFRRAFYDPDVQIATTALSALRTSDLIAADTSSDPENVFRHLRYLAYNASGDFAWPVQSEAAQTLAAIVGRNAFADGGPRLPSHRHLYADLLRAYGATGDPATLPLLMRAVEDSDPVRVCGALEGLGSLARTNRSDTTLLSSARSAALRALESRDVAVTGTAAGVLSDSTLRHPTVVPALIAALDAQRLPDDLESMLEIIAALGSWGDTRAVLPLLDQLRQRDRTIAVAAARALTRLTGADYLSRVPADPEPFFTDFDFPYLSSLPETLQVTIETARGEVAAEFYKSAAPFTVMALVKLSQQRGYFRGLTFHRVVPNFVSQGGCPRGDGWGGPGFTLRSEFSLMRYEEGTIGIASAGKDTEGSQFFVTHSPQPHLDGRYTIVGRVVQGMDVVRAIQRDDRIFDVKISGIN